MFMFVRPAYPPTRTLASAVQLTPAMTPHFVVRRLFILRPPFPVVSDYLFRCSIVASNCRVFVATASRFSRYAASLYTFRSLPRAAWLGIILTDFPEFTR